MGGESQWAVVSSQGCQLQLGHPSFRCLQLPRSLLLTGSQASFQVLKQQNLPSCFDFRTGPLGGVHLLDFCEPHSLSEPMKGLCSGCFSVSRLAGGQDTFLLLASLK